MLLRLYNRYVLPWVLHLACSAPAIGRQRERVVPFAVGRVLEIGIGTGLNLPFYRPDAVELVYGLEPAPEMLKRVAAKAGTVPFPIERLLCGGEAIPLSDGCIDSVVVTYTLCSVESPLQVLREIRRVLAPDGKLLFCEHGLGPTAGIRRWQRRLNWLWSMICGGCRLDRDIKALLREAGFTTEPLEEAYLPGVPSIVGYTYWGTAYRSDTTPLPIGESFS